MEPIEDRIWRYGRLPAGEQEEIEAYVGTHPEYRDLLDEVKWLYAYLKEMGLLGADSVTDEALAYLIANEYVGKHPIPPLLSAAYVRLARRVKENADVMHRYQAIKQRMEYVASFSNPSSEFERLTGYSLDEEWEKPGERLATVRRFVGDRRALTPFRARSPHAKRRPVFQALAGLGVIVLLLWLSNSNERLAYTESVRLGSDSELISIRTLDLPLDSMPVDVLALKAQVALNDAQRHWMNWYYWYDSDLLDEAEKMFVEILGRDDASVRLMALSYYFLGKINLARGKMEAARSYLEDAERLQDAWSDEASALLRRMRRGI